MVCSCISPVRWLIVVATLVVTSAANCEPAHLACEGAMSEPKAGTSTGDEKYLMSLLIDLNARTAKVEGHSFPIKGPIDEDVVAFASPRSADDVLDGSVNRITGEATIFREPYVQISRPVPPCTIPVLNGSRSGYWLIDRQSGKRDAICAISLTSTGPPSATSRPLQLI
jgi:hypothetical protein